MYNSIVIVSVSKLPFSLPLFQVDDIEEKLDRLISLYDEDRKRFAALPFASPHCPPCTPMASSPSPPYQGGGGGYYHQQQPQFQQQVRKEGIG